MLVGSDYTVLRSRSLHLLYPPLPFPFLPSLEVGPKFSYRGLSHGERQRCKLPSGVWGGAPAEIEFGAFKPYNVASGGNDFKNFVEIQLTKFTWCILNSTLRSNLFVNVIRP